MATKKSTPAKKSPAKKAAPTKAVAKVAAKKIAPASIAASKKAAVKATAKKSAPKKPAPAKAVAKVTPVKAAKAPAKKAAPVKAAPKKAVAGKAKEKKPVQAAPPPKQAKKPAAKAAPKKEQSAKPPVVPKLSTKSAVKYTPDFTKSILDTPKNEKVKAVVRYSDSDLQEFKEIILRKLDAAKKELAYLQGLITRRDEGGDMDEGRYMTMEDGSVSMEREQLSQLASRQITFIDHLEKALMRVENKTYGICRVTGNLIDKARLRAVPHATLSIEAKSMMNK